MHLLPFQKKTLVASLSLIFAQGVAGQQINEFRPNPAGSDPASQTIEILGVPGQSFSGSLLSVESDFGSSAGTVDRVTDFSGNFDADGLLTVSVPDLENPSFTLILTDSFSGVVGLTDIDTDNDGVADDLSTIGTVFDAIGVPDNTGDETTLYADDFSGINFAFTGDEPQLIFRDGVSGELYAINDPVDLLGSEAAAVSATGTLQPLSAFVPALTASGASFGAPNSVLGGTPPGPMGALLNEFQPNPNGPDPSQTSVELLGEPGESFSGVILSLETDNDPTEGPTVDRLAAVSGTFDANGILVVSIPDLENPSFKLVLAESYTGTQGAILDLNLLGTVFDALGVPDAVGDEGRPAGLGLGGEDFSYTGDEPQLVFRDGVTLDWYAVNDPDQGVVVALDGFTQLPLNAFTPMVSPAGSFGTVNPSTEGIEPPPPPPEPSLCEADPVDLQYAYDIQGARHVAPLVAGALGDADYFLTLPGTASADSVLTRGVVTAVDSNGFYLQDPVGDGDAATSDAVFVFTGSSPGIETGDEVALRGTISEFFPGGTGTRNLPTTTFNLDDSDLCSSGNALPAPVVIGTSGRIPPADDIDPDAFASFDPDSDGLDFFESLESMRVTVEDAAAVSGSNRFGEIFAVANRGVDATGLSQRGTLNIGPSDFNPERIQLDDNFGLTTFTPPQVDTGDLLGDVTGVLGYGFGNFEIYVTDASVDPISAALAPESTALGGDAESLTIASYNVLNLDPDETDGDTDVADGRFAAIATQIAGNLNTPDIIGLQEVQDGSGSNNDGVISAADTLQTLVDAIAGSGGPVYAFLDNEFIGDGTSGGQPGGNIRTAYLYNPERVSFVSGSLATIGGQGSGEAFEGARLPLVASFEFNANRVTVVNNHFSSKGGSAALMGFAQDFPARQEDVTVNGSVDERRTQSAEVAAYVSTRLAADSEARVVVLGDLNEFEFVSPVTGLEAAGLVNMTYTLAENERYSFAFQGNSQALDHILISPALLEGAVYDAVHTNSEFAGVPERASDHDPVLVSLELPFPQPENKGDCKKGGWKDLFRADASTFRNQGQCIKYVNTGR